MYTRVRFNISIIIHTDNLGHITCVDHEDKEVQLQIQYETILFFVTGAPREPPLKFDPTPSVGFQYVSLYPRSNTCSNTLYLPATDMPYAKFLYYVTYGMINTAGFGLV